MSNSPKDIIELTDIIEHGPGTASKDGADGGVDLSFERELEDLFAESPTDKPAQGAQNSPDLPDLSDLPGLDDLHLPEENAKDGGADDIDLDGLDALLAEAEKSGADAPGGAAELGLGDLPELTDDFLSDDASKAAVSDLSMFDSMGAPAAAAMVAASLGESVSSPALSALTARMDALEDKLQDVGDSLDALKAEPQADPAAMITELKESLEQRSEALKAELSALAAAQESQEPQPPIDETALAERVRQEVLSALPEPVAAETLAAQIAQVEARVDEKFADLQAASESQADPAAMIAELKESLEHQNEALKAELSALVPPAQEPLDEEALAERVRQEVLAQLPVPENGGAGETLAQVQELSGRIDAELSEVMARIEAIPAPADTAVLASKLDDLAALQEQIQARLDALEARPAAPDLGGLVSREELAALRRDILDEMQKAVPATAARIIREEIQALVQEMD